MEPRKITQVVVDVTFHVVPRSVKSIYGDCVPLEFNTDLKEVLTAVENPVSDVEGTLSANQVLPIGQTLMGTYEHGEVPRFDNLRLQFPIEVKSLNEDQTDKLMEVECVRSRTYLQKFLFTDLAVMGAEFNDVLY